MRQCLASLRELLPRNVSSERFTTLLLLKKAIVFIKVSQFSGSKECFIEIKL